MKTYLPALLPVLLLLAGCVSGNGSNELYGQIRAGVESTHTRY